MHWRQRLSAWLSLALLSSVFQLRPIPGQSLKSPHCSKNLIRSIWPESPTFNILSSSKFGQTLHPIQSLGWFLITLAWLQQNSCSVLQNLPYTHHHFVSTIPPPTPCSRVLILLYCVVFRDKPCLFPWLQNPIKQVGKLSLWKESL